MVADKLSIYNGALLELGERALSSLTENREPRRVLDKVWANSFIDQVLQMGQWNFAARTALLDFDPDVDPDFGFRRAFSKPTDWIRTMGISEDEYFTQPLQSYKDEAGFLWADGDELYFKWVSNDAAYGNDFAKWPPNFIRAVETQLARRVAPRLVQEREKLLDITKIAEMALSEAKTTDAMDDSVGKFPLGSWTRSRYGNGVDRERRGS